MISFSPPRFHPETIEEIADTLKSGWITTGPKTKKFEKELTAYCGCKITNAVNSATAGMEIVLQWFGVGPGDEVIVPAYTYCSTANVVMHLGATPVMADIRGEDFTMNHELLAGLITEKTKAIVPVDIGGLLCDYEAILRIVEEAKDKFSANSKEQEQLGRILVMADAAHSFGSTLGDKKSGALTDVSVFSFHAVKNLTTAEGGAICWNLEGFDNEAVYKYINTLILHGQSKDALAKTEGSGWRYDVTEPGYKCNMTDIQACLGLVELKHYDETLARRRVIFDQYNEAFKDESWAQVPLVESGRATSNCHLYMLRIKGDEPQRDQIINKIMEQNVRVNVHFVPLPELTAYKSLGYNIADYPVAKQCFSQEISLPIYYDLTDEQVARVIRTVKEAVQQVLHG